MPGPIKQKNVNDYLEIKNQGKQVNQVPIKSRFVDFIFKLQTFYRGRPDFKGTKTQMLHEMMDSIITGYISVRNYYCAEGRLGECLKYFKKHGFIDKDLVMIKDFTQMTHQEFKKQFKFTYNASPSKKQEQKFEVKNGQVYLDDL